MYTINVTQLIACQEAGMSSTETARQLGVSQPAVAWRAARLELVFVSKQGQGPKRKWRTCQSCADRKLCLLCHRLHVAALPCEEDLPYAGLHSEAETDPNVWPQYYQGLTCQVEHVVVE